MDKPEIENVALHVLVVGFHHKKGMQVEHCYPPLQTDKAGMCDLPDPWKHLPSLCLPDGAHNHEADTVYFNLPHLTDPDATVFGVSCYRQIDAEKVANKTADITRNSVQKSVCVLCLLPIYGYIQERLQVTTRVYFKGGDFSDVRDLEGLYHDLNTVNWRDKLYHVDFDQKYGCNVVDSVRIFGRNLLVLFKLMLLERGVLIYHSPVAPVVKTIVSLMSLIPDTLPDGAIMCAADSNVADPVPEQPVELIVTDNVDKTYDDSSFDSVIEKTNNSMLLEPLNKDVESNEEFSVDSCIETKENDDKKEKLNSIKGSVDTSSSVDSAGALLSSTNATTGTDSTTLQDTLSSLRSSSSSLTSVTSRASFMSPDPSSLAAPHLSSRLSSFKGRLSGAITYWTGRERGVTSPEQEEGKEVNEEASPALTPLEGTAAPLVYPELNQQAQSPTEEEMPVPTIVPSSPEVFSHIDTLQCGFPLHLFEKGYLVHPYLSLQQLELLSSDKTRAFLAGASNTLFLHKRSLYDVLVKVTEGKVEIVDPDLRRQLSLTTEDLRFADNIVRQVEALCPPSSPTSPHYTTESISWSGGEEWCRYQFRMYLMSLLRTSMLPEGSRELDMFNSAFVSAWRQTHHYKQWQEGAPYDKLMDINPVHPNAGNLSMSDVKLRLAHSLLGTERSRKINQTLATTGTAVVKTRDAVGGALTSARGAFTNFWSSITTATPETELAAECVAEIDENCGEESDCDLGADAVAEIDSEIAETQKTEKLFEDSKIVDNENIKICDIKVHNEKPTADLKDGIGADLVSEIAETHKIEKIIGDSKIVDNDKICDIKVHNEKPLDLKDGIDATDIVSDRTSIEEMDIEEDLR